MPDKIKIEILEDGMISIETDGISGKNHVSADEFLKAIEKNAGGTRTTKHRSGYTHTHNTQKEVIKT